MPIASKTKVKPVNKAHHRKRVAAHHTKNKRYIKAYWPYLPMLFIAILGVVLNNVWSAQGPVLGANTTLSSQSLLDDTNIRRIAGGKPALTMDTKLAQAAQAKAVDMAERNYWAHNAPDGKAPWNFIAEAGYGYETAGENMAYGFSTSADTIDGWMNSPLHRENVLHGGYKNVGFGIVNAQSFQGKPFTTIIVAMYASPGTRVADITFDVDDKETNDDEAEVMGAGNVREPEAQAVSRLASLSGSQAGLASFAIIALTSIGILVLALRNVFRIHRLINRGEHFVAKHPLLDIVVVGVVTTGIVLTRASGIIK